MIILDFSQVMLANLLAQAGTSKDFVHDELLVRHFVLNSIRAYLAKFKQQYGELVIACDSRQGYWRKDYFPYYKANRKKSQAGSPVDWPAVFETMDKIRAELKETFPWRVVDVVGAEGDDVVATLCHQFGNELAIGEKILVVSNDKDFRQLQRYGNVEQYDPINKKFIREPNPTAYLFEHTVRGDSGDGVPNIRSADDAIVLKIRQKPVTEEFVKQLKRGIPADLQRNWDRNQKLIDLNYVPDAIRESVMVSYQEQEGKRPRDLVGYFMKHRLRNLMEAIGDFT